MFEHVSINDIYLYEFITREYISDLLDDLARFNAVGAGVIRDFFSGSLDRFPQEAFNELSRLRIEIQRHINILTDHAPLLTGFPFYDLLTSLEDQLSALTSLNIYSKFIGTGIRASTDINEVSNATYVLRQGESLEDVSREVIGSSNPEDDWLSLGVDNRAEEEDYTLNGGFPLSYSFLSSNFGRNGSVSNQIYDVIDRREKLLGLDIDKAFAFTEDDIRVLDYSATFIQSANILLNLKTKDNPFFPGLGLSFYNTSEVGGSGNGDNIPLLTTLIRQLMAVFATDESIINFYISNFSHRGQVITIEANAAPIYGPLLTMEAAIN